MVNAKMLERVITAQKKKQMLDKDDMLKKLDVFLISNRINSDEYKKLKDLIDE